MSVALDGADRSVTVTELRCCVTMPPESVVVLPVLNPPWSRTPERGHVHAEVETVEVSICPPGCPRGDEVVEATLFGFRSCRPPTVCCRRLAGAIKGATTLNGL
jgi:hypothetical protein